MEKYIDLHIHSTYSEGCLTPRQIVKKAKRHNLKVLALTDHNTVGGVSDFLVLCRKVGIVGIPGIELYVKWRGQIFHILGYFIDIQNNWLRVTLEELCAKRYREVETMSFHLKKQGFLFDFEALRKTGSDYLGFGQIIEHLESFPKNVKKIKKDLKSKDPEFFDIINYYFKRKRGPSLEETAIPIKDALLLIKKAGGTAILAHPAKHLRWEQDYIILEMKKMGLAGIEVLSPYHTWHQIEHYQKFAKKNKLKITGGSDFHSNIPKTEANIIFSQWDYHKVPYSIYKKLK